MVAVLCGALVVTIVSDLTLLVRGDLPAETILVGNSSTTQKVLMDEVDTSLVDTIKVFDER